MSADAASHIAESRILQIIAEGSAQPGEQDHLKDCTRCRAVMTGIQSDLDRLRRQAAFATPTPERRFVLPADRPDRTFVYRWRWGWAALGTVLSAALLIIFLQVGRQKRPPGLPSTSMPIAAWEDPEMIEINRLAKSALPESYLVLSESLEGGYDEGFIDFLIPPLDDNSVS